MSNLAIDEIARVCHEANRAYCHVINEGIVQRAWDDESDEQRESVIAGVQALNEDPDLTPEQSHEKWLAYKKDEGWLLGPVKDVATRIHPNLLPYAELPADQKVKDALFQAVARALLP